MAVVPCAIEREAPVGGISVVVPTYDRPNELAGVLAALAQQTLSPREVIVVDAEHSRDHSAEAIVAQWDGPCAVRYFRVAGGAAYQRNAGIDAATGDFVAFVDDDVRPRPDVFERIAAAFAEDTAHDIGCIAARVDSESRVATTSRWLLYRRLGLVTTTRPGAFDRASGHSIPRELRPPETRLRALDVVGTGCAVWRRAVFDDGLRFAPYFRTYFANEDMHFALRAGTHWKICDLSDARFAHSFADDGRHAPVRDARHAAINSRFIFVDVVPRRTRRQEARFWAVHALELAGRAAQALVRGRVGGRRVGAADVVGYASGLRAAWRKWPGRSAVTAPSDRSDEV